MNTKMDSAERVTREQSLPKAAPRGRRRGRTARLDVRIVDYLKDVEGLVRDGLEALGLERFVLNFGEFEIARPRLENGVLTGCECVLKIAPGLGVVQPLYGPGGMYGGVTHSAQDLAAAFVSEVRRICERREDYAAARQALRRATTEVIDEVAREGLSLKLLSIEAVRDYVFVQGERSLIFDVEMMMLGDDYGPVQMDRYTMDAITGDEFANYLRHHILPEQRRFAFAVTCVQDN